MVFLLFSSELPICSCTFLYRASHALALAKLSVFFFFRVFFGTKDALFDPIKLTLGG